MHFISAFKKLYRGIKQRHHSGIISVKMIQFEDEKLFRTYSGNLLSFQFLSETQSFAPKKRPLNISGLLKVFVHNQAIPTGKKQYSPLFREKVELNEFMKSRLKMKWNI